MDFQLKCVAVEMMHILFFKEGVNRYPCSYYAQAALLSQEGNQLLKRNPEEAAEKYKQLIEIVKGKRYPYQEVLHTKNRYCNVILSGREILSK